MSKIPKKIHLIWLGGERPVKFNYLVDEIKRINDDYEIIEWFDDNIDFELKNQKLFDETQNLGAKSDILRFELLYRYGGIYMDYDFLQINKFDSLLNYEFFAGTNKDCPNEVWNSIVGSTEGNEICEKFLDDLKGVKPLMKMEIDRIMAETGPYYLTNIVYNNNWSCNYKILIGDSFFAFPATERYKIRNLSQDNINYIKSFATDNTYCLHLFTTTWQ